MSSSAPIVGKLLKWRNNFYAHRSSDHALNAKEFPNKYPLLTTDIEALLANGLKIINRYSVLFIATSHSTNIVGRTDYKWLLKAAQEALDAYEARIQKEFRHP